MVGRKPVDDRGFHVVAMRKVAAAGEPVPAGQTLPPSAFVASATARFKRVDRLPMRDDWSHVRRRGLRGLPTVIFFRLLDQKPDELVTDSFADVDA